MLVNVEKRPRLMGDFRRGGERLSESSWLLKERLRSALKLLSDQRLSTVQPVENHQPNRKSLSRSQTKDQTHGCDGSYPSLQRIVFAVFHHLNQNWRQQPLKFRH